MSANVPAIEDSPTVSLVAAGRAIGVGRTATYALVNRGEFPLPIISLGGKSRVPTAALRKILALDPEIDRAAAVATITRLLEDASLSTADRCQLALLLIGGGDDA